jgi:transposase InsO family protein
LRFLAVLGAGLALDLGTEHGPAVLKLFRHLLIAIVELLAPRVRLALVVAAKIETAARSATCLGRLARTDSPVLARECNWGQRVIAAECGKHGWTVSPRTVAKYRPRNLDRNRGQSWSTFLHNHLSQVWACDFFTIVSLRFRVLYGFVILALERRAIVHVGVTEHPTAHWTAQRVVEAIGDRPPPRFLLHDRDSIYGEEFRWRVRGLGMRELVTPPRSPTANAYCERVVGTLRCDCLDHLLLWDECQAERLLCEYVHYYDGRPHRGLRLQPPAGRNWLAPARPPPTNLVLGLPILGGLHHRYGTTESVSRIAG